MGAALVSFTHFSLKRILLFFNLLIIHMKKNYSILIGLKGVQFSCNTSAKFITRVQLQMGSD